MDKPSPGVGLGKRAARQGIMLFSGFALAQALSFARNALIGHGLSKGDFGIAATITLILQLIEILSDLGADRLIIQAPDGSEPRVIATAHATLVVRGISIAALLYLTGHSMAAYFQVPDAGWAFELAALVPLAKGFMHLDMRRLQRDLDNRPGLVVEVVPQAAALLLTVPVLQALGGCASVVWLAVVQAAIAVVASHLVAKRRYAVAFDVAVLKRLITFGWPIWASAFPLVVVYQGDRLVIGRLAGMEELATYSAAFMVTMVPGLLAAKVGNALMLPLLADAKRDSGRLSGTYRLLCDATAVVACGYLAGFGLAGGAVLEFVFGHRYAGLGALVTWLAVMWSLRMMQAVPGMALMAYGQTRPLLIAGLLRAMAVLPVAGVALAGLGVEWVAAMGCAGEIVSLVYVAWAAQMAETGLVRPLIQRTCLLLSCGLGAVILALALSRAGGSASTAAATLLFVGIVAGVAFALLPGLRGVGGAIQPSRTRS